VQRRNYRPPAPTLTGLLEAAATRFDVSVPSLHGAGQLDPPALQQVAARAALWALGNDEALLRPLLGVLDRQAAGTLPTRYERRRALRLAGRLALQSPDDQSLHAARAATAALRCAEDDAARNDWARDALVEAIELAEIRGGDARVQLLTELSP
jgi:hypothetical protein